MRIAPLLTAALLATVLATAFAPSASASHACAQPQPTGRPLVDYALDKAHQICEGHAYIVPCPGSLVGVGYGPIRVCVWV